FRGAVSGGLAGECEGGDPRLCPAETKTAGGEQTVGAPRGGSGWTARRPGGGQGVVVSTGRARRRRRDGLPARRRGRPERRARLERRGDLRVACGQCATACGERHAMRLQAVAVGGELAVVEPPGGR